MISTADLTDSHITVTTPLRHGPLIKEIPGSRYAGGDLWKLPRTLHAVIQLYGQLGPEQLQLSDELAVWAYEQKAREEALQALRERAMDPEVWDEVQTDELRGYQATALDFLRLAGSGILGDDPGVGKTRTALAWVENFPALVVCPKPVQMQWLKELDRTHPGKTHLVLKGTATKRRKDLAEFAADPNAGALVVSYYQLPLHSRLAPYGSVRLSDTEKEPKELNAISWGDVIADEVHRAFNPKTKWTRALWWLAHRAKRRVGLTGTPSEKSPLDLWALLHLADPIGWPSRSKFQDYFCETRYEFWGGETVAGIRPDRREEFDRLRNLVFLRRDKGLVLPFLPVKTPVDWVIELPPKLMAQYKALRKEMFAEVEGGSLELFDPIVVHGRLIQAASAQLQVDEEGRVTLTEPSPKVDALMEILDDYGRQPAAIFAQSRQLLSLAMRRFEKEGIPYAMVVGGMAAEDIEAARTVYNRGDVDYIFISMGASAEGLNLTRGSLEVFLDRSYRRLVNEQAEDRLHGLGRGDQDADHLVIVDIIAEGTVEEARAASLREKDDSFEKLFTDPRKMLED